MTEIRLVWLDHAQLTNLQDRLLPCPFCGRRAHFIINRQGRLLAECPRTGENPCLVGPKTKGQRILRGQHPTTSLYGQPYCHAETVETMVRIWNRRA